MGIGVVVFDHEGKLIHEISYGCIVGQNWHEPTSNNIAEYLALKAAIKWLNSQEYSGICVFNGDSKLVCEQMQGNWRIGEGAYVKYAQEAKQSLKELFRKTGGDCMFRWIPREQNEAADFLSKKALTDKGIKITIRTKNGK